jgi:hypothetical protein
MNMLHNTYLPFKEEDFRNHFIQSKKDLDNIVKYIAKYKRSIENYKIYEEKGQYDKRSKIIRQIEKDETFWTASSLMTIFYSPNRNEELQKILKLAFGEKPPLDDISSWEDCLNGELKLFFEARIPSPIEYRNWLKENVSSRNFIPYIIDKTKNKKDEYRSDLESATNVDALLLNSTNGFAVFIEAKVLSDISYQVSYDSMRNQIIRNIDVMLSSNNGLNEPLNKRLPENTLFLLITPKLFKDNPRTRLYGYAFTDYKCDPQRIQEDLKHRNLDINDCKKISKRIGWISWEDLKSINNECCKWIE